MLTFTQQKEGIYQLLWKYTASLVEKKVVNKRADY
jgi:hypothetical protein